MFVANITCKGQLAIPAEFRKKLGGILRRYAIKDKPKEEVIRKEKEVIKDVLTEKHTATYSSTKLRYRTALSR